MKQEKPFNRILMASGKLAMWKNHGDKIFDSESEKDELLQEAAFAVQTLLDFRNIVNGIVGLDQDPREAAKPYLE